MVYLNWLLRILVFVLLLGFSLKNLEPVTLNYFLGYQWREPLVVILLAATLGGVGIGLLASMGTLFRQRRELIRLRRELQRLDRAGRTGLDAAEARSAFDNPSVDVV